MDSISRLATVKSDLIYNAIDSNPKFSCPVLQNRSRMNIVFRVLVDGVVDAKAEADFLKRAQELGMVQLQGHRSVGGIRASCYNALSLESVQVLVDLMKTF